MKSVGVVVAILIVLASGGIAYASSDSGGTGCGGSHGDRCSTQGVFWTYPIQATPNAANVKCTILIDTDSDTLFEQASSLAPGQHCSFSAKLTNTGEQTVTITESLATFQPSYCKLFTYADNVPRSPPNLIPSGHYFAYQGTLSLSSSAGNACEGAFAIFHVLITGTPSARCSTER